MNRQNGVCCVSNAENATIRRLKISWIFKIGEGKDYVERMHSKREIEIVVSRSQNQNSVGSKLATDISV